MRGWGVNAWFGKKAGFSRRGGKQIENDKMYTKNKKLPLRITLRGRGCNKNIRDAEHQKEKKCLHGEKAKRKEG